MKIFLIKNWQTKGIEEAEGEFHPLNQDCVKVDNKFIFDREKEWFLVLESAKVALRPRITAEIAKTEAYLLKLKELQTKV